MCHQSLTALRCGCSQTPGPTEPCALHCGTITTTTFTELPGDCGRHSPTRPRIGECPPLLADRADADLHANASRFARFIAATRTHPRYLFRGYHGNTAATLEGRNAAPTGIYPGEFPPDVDYAIEPPLPIASYTLAQLREATALHIQGLPAPPSIFTSWTADFSTALWFAIGQYGGELPWTLQDLDAVSCTVAVLDTWALHPNVPDRERHVIHLPDLGWNRFPMEYLIYGPITPGPLAALRSATLAQMRTALRCTLFPFCPGAPPRREHTPTAVEVHAAVRVGTLFQAGNDAGADADVTLAVAASMLVRTQMDIPSPRPLRGGDPLPVDDRVDAEAEMWEGRAYAAVRDVLLPEGALPPLSGRPLVNINTPTMAQPQLRLLRNLLLPLCTEWRRRVLGEGEVVVGWDEWEWAVQDAAAVGLDAPHECPAELAQCVVCGKIEGRHDLYLLRCDSCEEMHCSPTDPGQDSEHSYDDMCMVQHLNSHAAE